MKAAADRDFDLVVDQVVDHLRSRRGLVQGQLDQLPALRDVEFGNGVAVDEEYHLAARRRRRGKQGDHGSRQQPGAGEPGARSSPAVVAPGSR